MKTLDITKLQARQCLNYLEYAKVIFSRFNQKELKTRISWDNDLKEIDGHVYFQKAKGDTCYRYLLKNHTVTKITINEEEVTVPYLEGLLGDLTDEEQKEALENMYLGDIQKYISERTGIDIIFHKKLTQNKQGNWRLELFTNNLVEYSGICKAMLTNITVNTDTYYYIDKYTGEQSLSTLVIYFNYNHVGGGSNGHECGRVRFNKETANFEGYNYDTQRYEAI